MNIVTGHKMRNVVVTGGAGFIGSNLVQKLLAQKDARVTVFDNLSRAGVERNLNWLRSIDDAGNLLFVRGDTRDADQVERVMEDADEIYHLAAQVAVTTSITDPYADFETNALGTIHVLEAARRSGRRPMVLFTSTNKVYGSLEWLSVTREATRCCVPDAGFRGISEMTPLDFHSPYGCSKGAADQYVHDYGRIYDLPTIVFRMSCIAGPRQFGNEDQGWVAHLVYSALSAHPITIYGDGLQVRDVLHVSDLVGAMDAARNHLDRTAGKVYNLGGGIDNAASVLEMLACIDRLLDRRSPCAYSHARPGDQHLYISDTAAIAADTGWRPRRSIEQIIRDIAAFWRTDSESILSAQPALARCASEETA